MSCANTPEPPYYAVIFTSINNNVNGYDDVAKKMMELVQRQPGFLGVESAREDLGITVSYWKDLESIKKWKDNLEHLDAQNQGKTEFYNSFKVRISKVVRDYEFKELK